ncbi:MAG TPA: hypothetical protein VLT33_17775 [Labilithrix sp.]|nr:hypothetical protein [Labilithrix sp.]
MMAGFGASDVVVCGRSRRAAALVLGILLPLALGVLCEATGRQDLQELVALLGAGEAIFFFFLPLIAPNGIGLVTGERRGPLRADREGITFRGRPLLARAQIRNVAVQPRAGGVQSVHVSATRRQDDLHIELPDEEKVRALLAALDVDPEHHVATFSVEEDPLRSRARWLAARVLIGAGALALALAVLALARRNELVLLAVVPVLLVYALLLPRARAHADILLGADGLTLRHRGRPRSIPLSAIREVRSVKNVATLRLEGGEELVLRFGGDDDEKASVQHAAFTLRMRQTLARRGSRHDPSEAVLARGAREGAEWSRHLQTLLRADEGYRVAAMPEETLWRIAEAAAAEPSARVGALVALRARLDDGARARLQGLAERTAQRELRAALEAAAEGAEADEIIAAYDRGSKT